VAPRKQSAKDKQAPKDEKPEKAASVDRGEAFHTKYRPQYFKHVIGQDVAVKALEGIISRRESQAFLFVGPSGCGKTTLARICALELGSSPQNISEFDAASNSGVDRVREILRSADYMPLGESRVRSFIIDEAHRLSGSAWDAMLKATEEPPPHVAYFLCTTNEKKVPKTIQTRFTKIQLKQVGEKDLGGLFDYVCDEEGINLPGDVGDMIIRESEGSPRQLLNNLALCRDVDNKKDAAQLLKTVMEGEPVLELCRFIMKGGSWPKCMAIYKELAEEHPEGVRIVVMRYFGKVIEGAKNDNEAIFAMRILDQFAEPYENAEGSAPLLRSIARALFAG
jgi:DNA polymerase III gamma/tau subunit